MATKLGKLVAYDHQTFRVLMYGEAQPIQRLPDSHHEITRCHVSMEYLISPFLQSLYLQTWQAGDAWRQEASHEVT